MEYAPRSRLLVPSCVCLEVDVLPRMIATRRLSARDSELGEYESAIEACRNDCPRDAARAECAAIRRPAE
jgi:hypothetical protein